MKKVIYCFILLFGLFALNSCKKIVNGCTDPTANNFMSNANNDDGSCIYLNIGDSFQGGVVAYFLKEGDSGYDASTIHGLIAAPAASFTYKWGCGSYLIGTLTPIGTGKENTLAIVNACADSGIAARYCNDLVIGDYNDWYLPSKDEMSKLFNNKNAIGGFNSSYYWTSSENDTSHVVCLHFGSGNILNIKKDSNLSLRAIRSF